MYLLRSEIFFFCEAWLLLSQIHPPTKDGWFFRLILINFQFCIFCLYFCYRHGAWFKYKDNRVKRLPKLMCFSRLRKDDRKRPWPKCQRYDQGRRKTTLLTILLSFLNYFPHLIESTYWLVQESKKWKSGVSTEVRHSPFIWKKRNVH